MASIATGEENPTAIVPVSIDPNDFVAVTEEPLELPQHDMTKRVVHPEAGAVSSFIGTTRDHFAGKQVVRLEYEAYVPMALNEMKKLCNAVRRRWDVKKIAMVHRIGIVEVKQASVAIAVSSEHRRESLEAVHWAIDNLKARVPVWKKEHYHDGSTWKQNSEYRSDAVCACGHKVDAAARKIPSGRDVQDEYTATQPDPQP